MVLQLKTNNDTFKCDIHLTVIVCTTSSFLNVNMSLSKLVTVFKSMILKMMKFLNLCGLSIESVLAIWPSQCKLIIKAINVQHPANNAPHPAY